MVQRMRVRVRWFFTRNFRKFNADDISAFITWFLVGQGLWILIGTLVGFATRCSPLCLFYSPRTTFFSAVFAVTNSLRLQGIRSRSSLGVAGLRMLIQLMLLAQLATISLLKQVSPSFSSLPSCPNGRTPAYHSKTCISQGDPRTMLTSLTKLAGLSMPLH
jgi:hypothetical protein